METGRQPSWKQKSIKNEVPFELALKNKWEFAEHINWRRNIIGATV